MARSDTHVLTHTLHYGLGVFEGVRAYETPNGPAIFRLQDHTDRLFRSAHILGMALPFSKDELNAASIAVVKENGLQSCYMRPMAFYGPGKLGVAPPANDVHIIVGAWPWGAYLAPKAWKKASASKPRRLPAITSTSRCARPRLTATT